MAREDGVFRKRARKLNGDLRWRNGFARTSVGDYQIEQDERDREGWNAYRISFDGFPVTVGRGVFSSEVEARKACTLDYEKRMSKRERTRTGRNWIC